MRLLLSRRAAHDLDEIAAYITQTSPQAAENVQARLTDALRTLAEQPHAGRSMGRGLRLFAVPRLPYLIIYRVDTIAGVVAVATIRHGARRPIV
ncbi:type II toxin-antitoxin system RelE/ParE family toxin [Methylobacterium sp. 77]|uniref:type II toxin-antitoxin system RelE/ParE family toxin n=1 Tax=Methylobacterium sp. 77 TaxID=1101192 RepID=UPI00036F7A47|nr:type II toxin-antitoxin system RelE/ParE family toxin [Methylobacterium sp. 77]